MRRTELIILLAFASPALATDGVLEINQACAVNTGCFAGDTTGYPVTITKPGSYRLTSNLTVPDENTSGIVVSTNHVGIDLNSFAIIRTGCENPATHCVSTSGTGIGVEQASGTLRGSMSVKNGSITGMGRYGVALKEQAEVTNLRVRWNRIDGISVGSGSIVSGNMAQFNGGAGISASSSIVSGNTVLANDGIGIVGGGGSTISGNSVFSNGGGGILASSSTVFGNTVRSNGLYGINVTGGASVQSNTVGSNGTPAGYGLTLGAESTYRENTITDNATGAVSGGKNLGANYCAGTGVVLDTCP